MKGGVVGRKGDPDCNLNFPNCLRVSCPWNIDYCCLTGNRNSLVSFYMGLERSLCRTPSSVLEEACAPLVLWLPPRCYSMLSIFGELCFLNSDIMRVLFRFWRAAHRTTILFLLCLKKKACCTLGEYNLALLSSPKAISRVTLCNG